MWRRLDNWLVETLLWPFAIVILWQVFRSQVLIGDEDPRDDDFIWN